MISLRSITVSYGGFTLLDDVSFHITEGEKIGLVGRNGAGKSTLLKLLAGEQSPTKGMIEMPSGIRFGYLPQIKESAKGKTVLEEAMEAFSEQKELEEEAARINRELETRTDYESSAYARLIDRLGEINGRLSMESHSSRRARAEKTLCGLGFKSEELGRMVETFSQGWNMRIALAKILLMDADVLLLDEPTNHLDIESIEWLEDYLSTSRCALLLVSHDRRFLDNVTTRTVEIVLGHIYDYKVPYSRYLELRAERMAQQTAAYENQQRMIEKTEEFINRFRYKPTKSNQVQARIKALEKLDRIEVDEADDQAFTLKFPPAQRSGDVVFKTTDLTAGYPGKVVFTGANVEIRRGEKVALVGRNGEGKTTLLRIMSRELDPIEGEAVIGHNIKLGYYAQNQEDILDGSLTVFETLDRIATGEMRTRLRDLLGAFLFRGDDIDKKVSVLSGGERARLGMAKLMLLPYNVLVLDEPTNHMDIRSKDILKQALKKFDGTLVVVSHDRDFLDSLVDKFYEVRDGRVKEHLGGVTEFLEKRKIENLQQLERRTASEPEPKAPAPEKPSPAQSQILYKEAEKASRKRRSRIDYLEKEIAKKEKEMSEIEKFLANPGNNCDILQLTRDYLENKRSLDALMEEWTGLMEHEN
ncbi:MAG: ABC-F family ATP-binding cassette domain-containing protein [Bacteroidales bacterium]|nr:ABC-F family ATP-binding cassette domain-containing protein [Bacteroidales bacterium]